MKTILVGNHKGGCGKSAISRILATGLADKQINKTGATRVLYIEADPQGNTAIKVLNAAQLHQKKSLFQFYKNLSRLNNPEIGIDKLHKHVHTVKGDITEDPTVWMLTACDPNKEVINFRYLEELLSSPAVLSIDQQTGTQEQYPELSPRGFIKWHSCLYTALQHLKEAFDYVVIDTPPGFSFITRSAAIAADYYIIPVIPSGDAVTPDVEGVDQFITEIAHLNAMFTDYDVEKIVKKAPPVLLGCVFNKVGNNTMKIKGRLPKTDWTSWKLQRSREALVKILKNITDRDIYKNSIPQKMVILEWLGDATRKDTDTDMGFHTLYSIRYGTGNRYGPPPATQCINFVKETLDRIVALG